ncbi:MAG: TPM domain-containing protein [Nitrospirota bacterium]
MSRLAFLCFLAAATFSLAPSASALDVPPLTGRVVDLAHVLPNSTVESLTTQLAAHEAQSSNQVAILIIPSLERESLEEFSHRVATTWKLGQQGTDNGALLLVAIQERKVRIEVGYGLEGVLTDARSAQIIRNEIVPRFRTGDMPGGVTAGISAILKTIEGTYQASEKAAPRQESEVIWQVVGAVMAGLLVGLFFMNIHHRLIGPVAGAGISTLMAPWLVPALMASGITLLLLLAIGASGTGGRRSRYSGIDDWVWYSSRGGGWGGGSFGGGGGFSGGGGDFGGGGASGNW